MRLQTGQKQSSDLQRGYNQQRADKPTESDTADQDCSYKSNDSDVQSDGAKLLMESSMRDLITTQTTDMTETGVEPWGKKVALPNEVVAASWLMRPKVKTGNAYKTIYQTNRARSSGYRSIASSVDDREFLHPQAFQDNHEMYLTAPQTAVNFFRSNVSSTDMNGEISAPYGERFDRQRKTQESFFNKQRTTGNFLKQDGSQLRETFFRIKIKDTGIPLHESIGRLGFSNFYRYPAKNNAMMKTFDDRLQMDSDENRKQPKILNWERLGSQFRHTSASNSRVFVEAPRHSIQFASIVKPSAQGILSLEASGPPSKSPQLRVGTNQSVNWQGTQLGGSYIYSKKGDLAGGDKENKKLTRLRLLRQPRIAHPRKEATSFASTKQDMLDYGSKIGIFPTPEPKPVRFGSPSQDQSKNAFLKPVLISHLQKILAKNHRGAPGQNHTREPAIMHSKPAQARRTYQK